jgi:glycogen operon protein
MTKRDWESSHHVGMFLNGEEIAAPDEHGQPVIDDSFLLLFNGGHEDVEFKLPPARFGQRWVCELRTDEIDGGEAVGSVSAGEVITVRHHSLNLLRRQAE